MIETQLVYEQMRCKIQTLEKENAEFKEDVKYYEQKHERLVTEWDNAKRQLTKAKDLLLRFIELKNKPCATGHSINMLLYENISVEAEKFLKEIDK